MATQPETPVKRLKKWSPIEDSPKSPTPGAQILRITDGRTLVDTKQVMDMMYRLVDEVHGHFTDMLYD